jgi:di/tricarboxylate transporter
MRCGTRTEVPTVIDYQPPHGLAPSFGGAESLFVAGESVLVVIALCWWVRRRNPVRLVLLMILVGTTIASFVEPLDDVASRL